MVAAEGVDHASRVGIGTERQCSELESGEPPFGSALERRDGGVVDIETHDVAQERSVLVDGGAQVGARELIEQAAGVQSRPGQRRLAAADDHHVQSLGSVLEQEADARVHVGVGNGVVIVQDQHHGSGAGEVVERLREDTGELGLARGGETRLRGMRDARQAGAKTGWRQDRRTRRRRSAAGRRSPGCR